MNNFLKKKTFSLMCASVFIKKSFYIYRRVLMHIQLFSQKILIKIYTYAIFSFMIYPDFTKCTIQVKNTRFPLFQQSFKHFTLVEK